MDSSQLFSSPANTTTTTTTATSSNNPISNELSRDVPGDSMRRFPEIDSLAFDVRKYPRNPFHSFLSTDPSADHLRRRNNNTTTNDDNNHHGFISSAREEQEEVDEQELELNLGLSLGGRFGIDKSRKRLTRSSSIAGTIPLAREQETMAPPPGAVSALVRTSSLPTETEEEWRRRKELQSLKRMEAKRRRSEKQRNSKDCSNIAAGEERDKGGVAGDTGISMNFRGRLERERQHLGFAQKFNSTSSVAGLGLAGQGVAGADRRDTDVAGVKGKRNFFSSLHGLIQHQQQQQQGSQGSVESHGGGSSTGASDPDSITHQGSSRSPATIPLLPERGGQETAAGSSSGPKPVEGPTGPQPTPEHEEKHHKRRESGSMEDMPCVFTIGDGPNGRKVEGILYKYGKGEEVRIMCVCHGSFFSPAEFVKHAGGRDVEHPLRHIVVNPSAAPFQ